MTIYNLSANLQGQASPLGALYWLFDIKLSLAKLTFSKFIYLNVGLGYDFVTHPPSNAI
jgi:hypothetical protein